MARKNIEIPEYGTCTKKGITYYRTRIEDVDGKRVELLAKSPEELYRKEQKARKEIEDAIFRRENPTVAEYCEKWLLMQSATVRKQTLNGYRSKMKNYIVKPLGDMYMADVTADDIRLGLFQSQKNQNPCTTQ